MNCEVIFIDEYVILKLANTKVNRDEVIPRFKDVTDSIFIEEKSIYIWITRALYNELEKYGVIKND